MERADVERWVHAYRRTWESNLQGLTEYVDPPRRYSNLWLVRLDPDGRAKLFIEYWIRQPD